MQTSTKREVAITAAETISGLGNHTSDIQEKVQQGASGILALTPEVKKELDFDLSDYGTDVISHVRGDLFQLLADIDYNGDVAKAKKFFRRMSRGQQLLYIVGVRAMQGAGNIDHISERGGDVYGEKTGIYRGSGKGSFRNLEMKGFNTGRNIDRSIKQINGRGRDEISAEEKSAMFDDTFFPKTNGYDSQGMYNSLISTLGYALINRYNLVGRIDTNANACAAGNYAFGRAFHDVQFGAIDFALSGGVESATTGSCLGTFARLKALSKAQKVDSGIRLYYEYPLHLASRPFDVDRNGFALGEGASMLTQESLKDAIERNANILCKVLGHGVSADPYHITSPHPEGIYSALAMKNALKDANLKPSDVSVIILHGTSTPKGDLAEMTAIKRVFGDDMPYLISAKGGPGHKLGDSGTDAIVQAVYMLQGDYIPPTANLRVLDNLVVDIIGKKHIDKVVMGETLRDMKLDNIMINSFAFGGACASTIVGKYRA